MRFMLFVCTTPDPHTPADPRSVPDIDAWVEEQARHGTRTDGDVLASPSEARTVRVRDGRTLITDGPFAETKEQIAGFDLLECESMDDALAIAAAHPMAHSHLIEVRPFHVWSSGNP